MKLVVAAFYKFALLSDFATKRQPLLELCLDCHIKGTILLAEEGINGTIAGARADIDTILNFLRSDPRLQDLEVKESEAETWPFKRMKVRLKQEIVTLGQPDAQPSKGTGIYVEPEDWNAIISDPTVTVIDTRNDYEVEIGTFAGAINPNTQSFRDFPEYVQTHLDPGEHQKIAMFCTGGIRCEKASAYMLQQGFAEVYHLKGGILKYLETVPETASLWNGECFVFDERVALAHGLKVGTHVLCQACGRPLPTPDPEGSAHRSEPACPYCSKTAC